MPAVLGMAFIDFESHLWKFWWRHIVTNPL